MGLRLGHGRDFYRVESCSVGLIASHPREADAHTHAASVAKRHKCAHVRRGVGATLDHRGLVVSSYGRCSAPALAPLR